MLKEKTRARGMKSNYFDKIAGLTLVVLLCLSTIHVEAAEPDISASKSEAVFTIIGFRDCKAWLQARRIEAKDELDLEATITVVWVQGFLTGLNSIASENRLSAIDNSIIRDWLDKYCKENPSDNVYRASAELFIALAKRTKPPSKP